MSDNTSASGTPWPGMEEYALVYSCPVCKAEPGTICDAPRKQKRAPSTYSVNSGPRALHSSRISLGIARYNKDVGNAPWPEDREPGKRYDSLPKEV